MKNLFLDFLDLSYICVNSYCNFLKMKFQIILKIMKSSITIKQYLFYIPSIKMKLSYQCFFILNILIPILLLHFQSKLNKFLLYLLLPILNLNNHYLICIMEIHTLFYHILSKLFLTKVHCHTQWFFQIF